MKTKVINLIGGAGTGKSTIATGLFSKMKMQNYDVELSLEFAKDLVWEQRYETFKDELYIFAKQAHKLFRLDGKVEYVVTDRPLIMSEVYNKYFSKDANNEKWNEKYYDLVLETWNKYDNINIFLNRVKPFVAKGRNESEQEAKELDIMFRKSLDEHGFKYYVVDADENAIDKILDIIKQNSNCSGQRQ